MGGLRVALAIGWCAVACDAVRQEFPINHLQQLLLASSGSVSNVPRQPAAPLRAQPWNDQTPWSASATNPRSLQPDQDIHPAPFQLNGPAAMPGGQITPMRSRAPRTDGQMELRGAEETSIVKQLSPKAASVLQGTLSRTNLQKAQFDNLDDATATAITESVKKMVPTVSVLDFSGNERLSGEGFEWLIAPMSNKDLRLQEIRFGGCDLDDSRGYAIGQNIGHFVPNVRKVDFSDNFQVSATGWKSLMAPMTRHGSTIEDIRFSGNNLEDVRAKAIAMQLMNMGQTVKALHFSGNGRLSTFGWTALLRPISGSGSRFEDIRFGECDLDDDSAKAIFEQFVNMGPTVRKLNFEGNRAMTSAGWRNILQPLSNYRRYRYLEEVNFGYCDLDDMLSLTIGRYLDSAQTKVKKLNFANASTLSSNSWEALLKAFTLPDSGLISVDLGECGLSDKAAHAIGSRLETVMPTVGLLHFGHNRRLSVDGWKMLLDGMSSPSFGIEELDFNECDLDDARAEAIVAQMKVMDTSVKSLYFENNAKLSPVGWTTMLQPLTRFGGGLEVVDFRQCDLDDVRAKVIGEQLGNLVTTLKRVSFKGNSGLSAAGWTALLLPLTKFGSNVEEIDFSDCNLDAQRAQAIGKSLMRLSPNVKSLSFKGKSMLSAEGWEAMLRPLTWDDKRMQQASNRIPRLK